MRIAKMWVCLLVLVFLAAAAGAAPSGEKEVARWPKAGWSTVVRGGYLHQLETDIDSGGRFSVNRFFIQGGPTYTSASGTTAGLAIGYGYDGYFFSGDQGFGGRDPWSAIHALRLSTPVRWRVSRNWMGFASPTIRTTGENGADYAKALTGGGFAGFAYRFGDRLSLGPGIGVLTQIEESARVIPVLVIDWNITKTVSLSTGRGLGATLGPGLSLNWRPRPSWTFSLGGRYESLRFRLDKDGSVPNGVGDDRSFPLFLNAGYRLSPRIRISLIGGLEMGGELRLEDENGNLIAEQDHGNAGFFGFSVGGRF